MEGANWFLKALYTHSFEINAVGFATPRSDSTWMMHRDQGRATEIVTPNTGQQYESIEISLRGSDR